VRESCKSAHSIITFPHQFIQTYDGFSDSPDLEISEFILWGIVENPMTTLLIVYRSYSYDQNSTFGHFYIYNVHGLLLLKALSPLHHYCHETLNIKQLKLAGKPVKTAIKLTLTGSFNKTYCSLQVFLMQLFQVST
jgi:hypothetical protein